MEKTFQCYCLTKNSPDSLTNLIGAYVIDIADQETDESQEVILLCNMEEDELTSDPGFDFSDGEEEREDYEDT